MTATPTTPDPDPARLDAIRARLAAATPGPWHADWDADRDEYGDKLCEWVSAIMGPGGKMVTPINLDDQYTEWPDIDLIANAPADIAYLLARIDALEAAEARVAAAIAALDKRRSDGSDDCHCRACERIQEDAADTFTCELCGYHGAPLVMECGCYDRSCIPGSNGTGCSHGALYCPACDDGDNVGGFEIVRDVRAALGVTK